MTQEEDAHYFTDFIHPRVKLLGCPNKREKRNN
jgi:hypothetical protein